MRNDLPNEKATNFTARVRETLMTYLGKSGDPLDRGITLRDLVENGIVSIFDLRAASRGTVLPLTTGSEVEPAYTPDLTPPPTPTGFTATAGVTTVTVQTDEALYTQGHGHLRTHIYGATRADGDPAPVFADATEVGQYTGLINAFSSNPATVWHLWVKWETRDGVLGEPAGGTNGVVATTSEDVTTLLDALTSELDGSGNPVNPNTLLITRATTSTINGVSVPAGVYMKDTYIQNGVITNAKIGNAAIDSAKIGSAAVTTAKIADANITTAKIADANITSAKIADANITTAKIASAAITLAKIDVATITSLSALSATLGTVTAGTISASELTVGSTPAISGTSMSGSGTRIYSDGKFAIGNSSSNIVFNGSKAYINGFTAQVTSVEAGGYSDYWPANTSSYTRTGSEQTITGFDASRPFVVHLAAQMGVWCSTVGNSSIPDRVDGRIDLQYSTSTDGGSSYGSWYTVNNSINMWSVADRKTSVTGSNRLFYSSGAWVGTLSVGSTVTHVKVRIVRTYTAWTSITAVTAAYFGGPLPSPLTAYTQVDTLFDNCNALVYQVKV